MPPTPPTENVPVKHTTARRPFPFRLVLPLGQLVLCAVLLVMVCGPDSLMPVIRTGTIYVETKGVFTGYPVSGSESVPAKHEQPPAPHITATGRVLASVFLLNLPGSILTLKLAAYGSTHQGFVARAVHAFTSSWLSGAVLALPLWWIAGRGADALVALKRKAIHPRIRFAEAAISFLLLMGGALFTVFGIYVALSGAGSWMVAAASLMWAVFGGLGVRAWQMQLHGISAVRRG
ncbi:MAG TPA: hypothetical protein VFW31_11565 [Candidatus Angelobacter sp.]|nr:hypothetical protein [Candidatus Angelobacter sp.]